MPRVCFLLRVDPDRIAEYRAQHEAVWPDMLREIEASGRRNYSLFDGGNGVIIGYFETDDLAASNAYLARSDVAAAWEAHMRPFFATVSERADQELVPLAELFNLTDQLALARANDQRNA